MRAEDEYLFRHAVMRDAAYQLQLPSKRARLHRLAFEAYERTFDEKSRDAVALEVAQHAAASGSARLRRIERKYLKRAVDWLTREFQLDQALHVCRKLIAHPNTPHTEAVDWMLRGADLAIQAGAFASGRELADQALAADGGGPSLLRALNLAAMARDSMGEREEALSLFRQCADRAKAMGNAHGHARALAEIAHTLNRAGRSGEAEDAFRRAYSADSALDDAEGRFTLRLHYAQFLIQAGRSREALPMLETAQARAEHSPAQLSRILIAKAVALEQCGHKDDAIPVLESAASVCRAMNDRRSLAVVQNNLAIVWWRQKKFAEARETYVSILSLVRELGEYSEEALAVGNIASLDYHMGNVEQARVGYLAALEIAARRGDLRQQLKFEGALGMILHKIGHLEDALARFDRKLALARNTRDRRAEGVALQELGEVLLDTGRRDEAIEHLEAARSIFNELGDTANLKFVEEQFARLK